MRLTRNFLCLHLQTQTFCPQKPLDPRVDPRLSHKFHSWHGTFWKTWVLGFELCYEQVSQTLLLGLLRFPDFCPAQSNFTLIFLCTLKSSHCIPLFICLSAQISQSWFLLLESKWTNTEGLREKKYWIKRSGGQTELENIGTFVGDKNGSRGEISIVLYKGIWDAEGTPQDRWKEIEGWSSESMLIINNWYVEDFGREVGTDGLWPWAKMNFELSSEICALSFPHLPKGPS